MVNSIRTLSLRDHRIDAAEAEIWITVVPEQWTATTELRGRFVGPRCPGRTTLELAYPLRPSPPGGPSAGVLTARVIIIDPCLWTTDSPYCYDGKVELWQDGQRCDVKSITLRLGKAGSVNS